MDAIAEYEAGGDHDSAGRADEAISYYERALRHGLPPELEPRCRLQLASSLRNVGRIHDAIAAFDDAIARYPNDAALRLFRAFALADVGREREALVDVIDLARTRIHAPEISRYGRSLKNYNRDLLQDA